MPTPVQYCVGVLVVLLIGTAVLAWSTESVLIARLFSRGEDGAPSGSIKAKLLEEVMGSLEALREDNKKIASKLASMEALIAAERGELSGVVSQAAASSESKLQALRDAIAAVSKQQHSAGGGGGNGGDAPAATLRAERRTVSDAEKQVKTLKKGADVVPPEVRREVERVTGVLRAKGRGKLADMFAKCYPNTLETTTELLEDGTTFVLTGDIPDMWLRDSAAQVHHYMPLAKESPGLQRIIEGLIRRHIYYINAPHDKALHNYANAFRRRYAEEGAMSEFEKRLSRYGWIATADYELDSHCYSLWLIQSYWKATGRTDAIFTEQMRQTVHMILDLWRTEQHHEELSPYRYSEFKREGRGPKVTYTGMTWSGARPSDDPCQYGYLVPSNMFVVVVIQYIVEWADNIWGDAAMKAKARAMEADIQSGINKFAIKEVPEIGRVYAYEVDGFGNQLMMDDANVPSLLSIDYLGYKNPQDPSGEIARNTRRFVLSQGNPFFVKGSVIQGVGSPHTPGHYVWHLALAQQALTAPDKKEALEMVAALERSDGGTLFMHEGVWADDPNRFTRAWFAWANSLFSEVVLKYLDDIQSA
jgi:meiotically up-regulated gene 157 (Mug157) protein